MSLLHLLWRIILYHFRLDEEHPLARRIYRDEGVPGRETPVRQRMAIWSRRGGDQIVPHETVLKIVAEIAVRLLYYLALESGQVSSVQPYVEGSCLLVIVLAHHSDQVPWIGDLKLLPLRDRTVT